MSKQLIKNKNLYTVNTVERKGADAQFKAPTVNEKGEETIDWKHPRGKVLIMYILIVVVLLVLGLLIFAPKNTGVNETKSTAVVLVNQTDSNATTGTTTMQTQLDLG